MKKYVHWMLAATLMGCGGSGSSDTVFGGQTTLTRPTVSGRVLSETNVPVGGVRVVVHERTSNAKVEGISGADGSFRFDVDPGVYDLGLDLSQDTRTATCFYGPLDTSNSAPRDFILHDRGGRPAGTVFGKIWLQPGTPAARRKVNLVGGFSPTGATRRRPPAATATQADGSFEVTLPSAEPLGLDLEVYDGQDQLDEFIDVGMLEKPVFTEFVTEQSPVENRLRSGESELSASVAPKAETAQLKKFNFEWNFQGYVFSDGFLPVNKVTYNLLDLTNLPLTEGGSDQDHYELDGAQIRLDTNGMWWWKYAVNVHVGYPIDGREFVFTDVTQDGYRLWIVNGNSILSPSWHKVSYNSDFPSLIKITAE